MSEKFMRISPKEMTQNPFEMIGSQWFLLCAEKEGKANAMTASWGGVGVLWRKNVVTSYVRKSRYTKELIDDSDVFSLCFFDHEPNAKMLGYMGSVSGRDEDKIAKCNLTLAHCEGAPYFEEATTVLICKKLCRQYIAPENILEQGIIEDCYADGDYHDMYIGEILAVLVR